MFLAPFGMLISKWAALKAYVDSRSILLVIFLVFGSATTLFTDKVVGHPGSGASSFGTPE